MNGFTTVANFLVVNDIKTILNPNASTFDRALAVAGFTPFGKVFSADDLKTLAQADQKDIKRITGNATDAFDFFKEQVSSYNEVSPGVLVGKDANGVTFSYRSASKSGPPTIDVNGISGVRKIKFLEE